MFVDFTTAVERRRPSCSGRLGPVLVLFVFGKIAPGGGGKVAYVAGKADAKVVDLAVGLEGPTGVRHVFTLG